MKLLCGPNELEFERALGDQNFSLDSGLGF